MKKLDVATVFNYQFDKWKPINDKIIYKKAWKIVNLCENC